MKKTYFKTSDGTEFYTENNALNHARTLEDKTVSPPEAIVEDVEVDTDEDSFQEDQDDEADKDQADKTDANDNHFQEDEGDQTDAVVKVNFGRMNKAQLITYAADHQLTIDEAGTNSAIIASIEAQLTAKNVQ